MTMLSRVAGNIYWMARYVERAENTARLVNVNTHLLLDLPRRMRLGWDPLIEILSNREAFSQHYQESDERSVLRFLVASPGNPSSILSCLVMARENARTIRDIIPREAWEQINEVYLFAKGNSQRALAQRSRYVYLRDIILGMQTVTGLLSDIMQRDEAYDFLRMGRNLERADMTTRIIDVRTATLLPNIAEDLTPFENIQWVSVLKSLTAYQMYRRTVRLRVRRPEVLRFLFQERNFPRAVYHATCEVEACLNRLPHNDKPLRALGQIQRKVLRAKPENLSQQELHEFIDELQVGLGRVHGQIHTAYF